MFPLLPLQFDREKLLRSPISFLPLFYFGAGFRVALRRRRNYSFSGNEKFLWRVAEEEEEEKKKRPAQTESGEEKL